MKVSELIHILNKCDPDTGVCIYDTQVGYDCDIKTISKIKDVYCEVSEDDIEYVRIEFSR